MWPVDIKTAFLHAELDPDHIGKQRNVVRAPQIWQRLKICEEPFWSDVRVAGEPS